MRHFDSVKQELENKSHVFLRGFYAKNDIVIVKLGVRMKRTKFVSKNIINNYLLLTFVFLLLSVLAFLFPFGKMQMASASVNPSLKCYRYDVEMNVNTDRTIEVKESIDIEFLRGGFTMFYKSLPKDSKYSNILAACEGNDEFTYYVDDNPDYSEFIDICCVGGADRGNRWTYEISYLFEPSGQDVENGMRLDIVGFGSPFELNDVNVTLNFPERPLSCHRYISGVYGSNEKQSIENGWTNDGKTLFIHEDKLELVYNDTYNERMAEGITLEFTFEKGVLDSFTGTQMFTERTWIILLIGLLSVGFAIGGYFLGKNHGQIIPVVNVKAPNEMDPMRMGFLIDGSIGDEDVTSMIYYFADKGYLTIDFSNKNDPVLTRVEDENGVLKELPATAPIYQKTLFEGLFKNRKSVPTSALKEKYYESVDEAKIQLMLKKPPRYDKKSVAFFLLSTLFSCLLCAVSFVLAGNICVGGDYAPADGVFIAVFLIITALLLWVTKELEFKKSRTIAIVFLTVAYCIGFLIFILFTKAHIFTAYEKLYLSAFAIITQLIGFFTLSRTESYNRILGDILGFKDFIVVTEEDKIKVMLEENPELYYKVLPYAQVLGVTDEWTDRFRNILIEKPSWAVGLEYSVFDYMLINHSMRTVTRMMAMRPQNTSSTVGRTGGGGFGGFSGGGRGGGGFGAR